jgi:hypothetical protein
MTNDESNLASKLKSQCMQAQSIAEIQAVDKAATKEKKLKELRNLLMLVGGLQTLNLLQRMVTFSKITKREIHAILLVYTMGQVLRKVNVQSKHWLICYQQKLKQARKTL